MDQMLQYWFMYKVGPIMLLMQQLLRFYTLKASINIWYQFYMFN